MIQARRRTSEQYDHWGSFYNRLPWDEGTALTLAGVLEGVTDQAALLRA